ncbi:MAG: CHASE4 domain-containing protein [Candidatus Bathyarchaeia archaeon]
MYGKAFDLHTMTEEPIPNSILEKINVNGTILNASNETNGVKGLILTSEDPMLIVSRPILTSYDEGPIQGTLIIGRYYDSTQITRLAQQTHLSIMMKRLDDSTLPEDFQTALSHISEEDPFFVQPLDSKIVAGYTLIRDIFGQPILLLKVEL